MRCENLGGHLGLHKTKFSGLHASEGFGRLALHTHDRLAYAMPHVYAKSVTHLQTIIVERPPPGPARGKWEAPTWAIVLIAVSAALVASGYWLWRLLRARKNES